MAAVVIMRRLLAGSLASARLQSNSFRRAICCSRATEMALKADNAPLSRVAASRRVPSKDRVAFTRHSICHVKKTMSLEWKDRSSCSYPFIFLRDNCQCPSCSDPSSLQRRLETMFEVNLAEIAPVDVALNAAETEVKIEWNDGHSSTYDSSWLWQRRFPEPNQPITRSGAINYPLVTWGGETNGKIPAFDFKEMQRDEDVLLDWLETLASSGLAILTNAEPRVGQLEVLQKLLGGFRRSTNYGHSFIVEDKPSPSNLAYTAGTLLLHLDLPFYELQPGIQILHFVKHRVLSGGDNHLVDGFKIAEVLREEKPDLFQLLTTVNFVFRDIGSDEFGEFFLENERPVIGLDRFGKLDSVGMNNHSRGCFINAPTETVQRTYEAMYAFYEVAYRPENLVTHKCGEGDMLTFNNRRVMHGRAAYDSGPTGHRLLQGCYFDWDSAFSTIRCLLRKRGHVV